MGGPAVSADYGRSRGRDGLFKNIPQAAPAAGDLRFRSPIRPEPRAGSVAAPGNPFAERRVGDRPPPELATRGTDRLRDHR
ncbi:hypothetical protein J2S41_002948 [Catenuloplanes atrovinosus]|uniref:Uncharacterized protein n=1 Tax=Catenuloplanes atrovinosus TaxID=137266 RepID=A0AAE3YMC5_9ACTN|nr:hypothetical protein [Catenuloplanes atrovinosus]